MIRVPQKSTPFPYPALFVSRPLSGQPPSDVPHHPPSSEEPVSHENHDPPEGPLPPSHASCDGPSAVSPSSHDQPPSGPGPDRKSTRLNSSHANISYAVFCLK